MRKISASVVFEPELYEKIKELAKKENRSMSNLIMVLLRKALEDIEE